MSHVWIITNYNKIVKAFADETDAMWYLNNEIADEDCKYCPDEQAYISDALEVRVECVYVTPS